MQNLNFGTRCAIFQCYQLDKFTEGASGRANFSSRLTAKLSTLAIRAPTLAQQQELPALREENEQLPQAARRPAGLAEPAPLELARLVGGGQVGPHGPDP
jgi:hypothetical protein